MIADSAHSSAQNPPLDEPSGLTMAEAGTRLARFGVNTVTEATPSQWQLVLEKVWSPVPWMLEAAIVLELCLQKFAEAGIIAALLLFNAIISLVQAGRAQGVLKALKSRLAQTVSVRRDGEWRIALATDVVPGDIIKLSLGGIVAADARIVSGKLLLDQSMLTGESLAVEASSGEQTFAGTLVRRGEAIAEVTSTGIRTKFGRSAELTLTAQAVSSQQTAVVSVVRNLVVFALAFIVVLAITASTMHLPLSAIVPLLLTAVLGSIPVALPATFTLAAAIGAKALAKVGVLPTRLSAVDEAGTMAVLCVDKTGTLTQNRLAVASVHPVAGVETARVLSLAALASSEGGQDPVDSAIRSAVGNPASDVPRLIAFVPFDPAVKMSEATATDAQGARMRIVKGAFTVVSALAPPEPDAATAAKALESEGLRVLAVVAGPEGHLKLIGLIALSDPPRADSAALIRDLHQLGVRTVMVTGDAPTTARIVANEVGLTGEICPPDALSRTVQPASYPIFAGVLPEEKFKLVKMFQSAGLTVGMCGDGVNDAPALRQAQIGIAVSTATDVAKSAAGMVLTEPGLSGILAAVREGRTTFQRIQTYTVNSITKKIVTVLFLLVGLAMTGGAILTPRLMVIVMIAGDFLAMSLTTDTVIASPRPNVWRIGRLTIVGFVLGLALLGFCSGVLAMGVFVLHLPLPALQTLSFVTLVFGSQAMIYAIRSRPTLWSPRPSLWLAGSSVIDIVIASALAMIGIAMEPISAALILAILLGSGLFAVLLGWIRQQAFRRLGID